MRVFYILSPAALLLVAAAAGAQSYLAHSWPGANCKPTNELPADWVYDRGRLVNTLPEGFFLVTCPLPQVHPPGYEAIEYRVYFEDPAAREGWCSMDDARAGRVGPPVDIDWESGSATAEVTAHPQMHALTCTLEAGAQLLGYELLYKRR